MSIDFVLCNSFWLKIELYIVQLAKGIVNLLGLYAPAFIKSELVPWKFRADIEMKACPPQELPQCS